MEFDLGDVNVPEGNPWHRPGALSEKLSTSGDYETETEAWAALDAILDKHRDLFYVFREVEGFYLQPRLNTRRPGCRIDRLLWPMSRLVSSGWPHGAIGVECKVSKKNAGRVILQAIDYTRAAFTLPTGVKVLCEWVAVWPLDSSEGAIASIMCGNRVGCLSVDRHGALVLRAGGTIGFRVWPDGKVEAKRLPMGRKAGSR